MNKEKYDRFLFVYTGLLVAFPALTTDLYLPGFPQLADYFQASASNIQMTLMSAMIGIAAGQLIIGPLSDRYGRKRPLTASLLIFILGTSGCIFSKNITAFIISRFAQGLSCSSGMVLSRAILADSYSGKELAKSLSANTAILGITPTFAPVAGGIILTFSSWKGGFVALLAICAIFIIAGFKLEETLPAGKRQSGSLKNMAKNIAATIGNKTYLTHVLIFTFSMAVMFAYIASSPFIFQEHYHLSPLLFSVFFGINALSSATGSLLASRFSNQEKALKTGACGLLAMSIVAIVSLLATDSVALFEISLVFLFFFNGLNYPSSTTLALESARENAGAASAMLGAMSFFAGGIISPLAGLGNILYATSAAIILCSLIVFLSVLLSPGHTSVNKIRKGNFLIS